MVASGGYINVLLMQCIKYILTYTCINIGRMSIADNPYEITRSLLSQNRGIQKWHKPGWASLNWTPWQIRYHIIEFLIREYSHTCGNSHNGVSSLLKVRQIGHQSTVHKAGIMRVQCVHIQALNAIHYIISHTSKRFLVRQTPPIMRLKTLSTSSADHAARIEVNPDALEFPQQSSPHNPPRVSIQWALSDLQSFSVSSYDVCTMVRNHISCSTTH
jgi:hypothetical protein